jgi:hypothetical protein
MADSAAATNDRAVGYCLSSDVWLRNTRRISATITRYAKISAIRLMRANTVPLSDNGGLIDLDGICCAVADRR